MEKNVRKSIREFALEMGFSLDNGLEVTEVQPVKAKRPRLKTGTIVGKSYGELDLRKCFSATKVLYAEKTFDIVGFRLEVKDSINGFSV